MCTVLYCTVLYCTVLYCTVLYCTVLYCTVLYCTLLYCTVLYCTVLYSTVLYFTVLYCTVLYCTVLYFTVLYCTVLYCTVLYCTVLYCTALYCTVLYCTVLYCTVLYCTVLYCTALPPGFNPIAVNKIYSINWGTKICHYWGILQRNYGLNIISCISSITNDAMINPVPNTLNCCNRTGYKAFISSEIRSLRLCECAERVRNSLIFKTAANRQLDRRDCPRTVTTNIISSGEIPRADGWPQSHVFIKWRPKLDL